MMRVTFTTLGCKINQVDTAHLEADFRRAGYEIVTWPGPADVCIVNTCTVTARADRQSRQSVRRARRANPNALVVVTGCGPLTGGGKSDAFQEADLITGNLEKANLSGLVQSAKPGATKSLLGDMSQCREVIACGPAAVSGRSRAFLKVQDGCNAFCAYCIVPLVRGPSRSVPPGEVVSSVQELLEMGYAEVVLTGIHLGFYGTDSESPTDLAQLCRQVLENTRLPRLRLSSVEPLEVTDELIELMAREDRLCSHLHIPLQSGSDRVLQAMKRPYKTVDYEELVRKCRAQIVDVTIGADLVVGFPGETEEDFTATYALLEKLRMPHLHVFPYSDRPGTASASMPNKLPAHVVKQRAKQIRQLADVHRRDHRRSFVGKTLPVLIERVDDQGEAVGTSRNYLPVRTKGSAVVGEEVGVRIITINDQDKLIGLNN